MMKKLAAILALALAGALLLTGCVAAAPALDESQIDRPTVVVTLNGEALEATVEPEETAEATAAPTAEAICRGFALCAGSAAGRDSRTASSTGAMPVCTSGCAA